MPEMLKQWPQGNSDEMTAQRLNTGQYEWIMTVAPLWTSSTVLVTAYGAPGNYCNVNDWVSNSTSTLVYVNCFNSKARRRTRVLQPRSN